MSDAEQESAISFTVRDGASVRSLDAGRVPSGQMPGSEWRDVVHYIEDITSRIWDFKDMGLIYRFYTPTTLVHTSDGDVFGRDTVLENSIIKLGAFPDLRDYVEDVVWTPDGESGFRTSMRWTWTAHHTGHSVYGPPTGRKVVGTGIANCIVRGEQIVEEWVCYDELGLLRQLGIEPREYIRRLAVEGGAVAPAMTTGEVDRLIGQGPPASMAEKTSGDFEIEDFVRRSVHEIWNWRLFGHVDHYYSPVYRAHMRSDRELYGLGDYKQHVVSWLAAFPDGRMHIDDVYWVHEGGSRYRTAVLWTFTGSHRGPGLYGPPSGRRVRVIGITHHRVEGGRFVEEWTNYGELSLLKQILLPLAGQGDVTSASGSAGNG